MPVYNIADLNIKINPVFPQNTARLEPYRRDCAEYDFDASVTLQDISARRSDDTPDYAVESSLILEKICTAVLEKYDGFFFHSSALMLDGEAYVFTAQSGTGKSTHTLMWREHFGGRVTMINDDKPIIRKTDGGFFIYGTPWMGKSNIGGNLKAPVKAVYVLRRSEENYARKAQTGEVFKEILEATVIPNDKRNMTILLSLLDEFFSSAKLILLECNISDEAVTAAYNAANQAD